MKGIIIFALSLLVSLSLSAQALVFQHSFANPEAMQVRKTHLAVTIDFDQKALRGSATLYIDRLQGTELWLDAADLVIGSVRGDVVSYEQINEPEMAAWNLGQPLKIKTLDKDSLVITIEYETSPTAAGLVWLEGNQTLSGQPFMFAMNEPIGARSWFPCQDSPQVRGVYSADLSIKADDRLTNEPLLAIISGENNVKESNAAMHYGNLTSTKAPIPSYLFVLAAGFFKYKSQDESIGYYADNDQSLDAAMAGFGAVPRYFAELKKLLGPNPWQQQDFLFLPAMFGFGGMENPMAIYINEGIVEPSGASSYVMAHELAHMWTGNVVTNEDWSDFWLNEGWTSYYEDRILEAVHGSQFGNGNNYERHLELIAAEEDRLAQGEVELPSQPTRLHKLNAESIHPDELSEISVYSKGALLLHTIERLVGRSSFDSYASNYIKDFSFKPITSALFVEYSAAKLRALRSDIDWEAYLKAWIFEAGMYPAVETFGEPAIPQCEGCEEKVAHFANEGPLTDFSGWNRFQLTYLLKYLEQVLRAQHGKNDERLSLLLVNPSFMNFIAPIADLRSLWYQVSILGGIWQEQQKEIRQFLTEFGRGRLIRPLYKEFMQTSDPAAHSFAKSVFEANKNRYFAPIRQELERLFQ